MIISPKFYHESNREYALRVIRDNIINLQFIPGSLVAENDIASQLGISRTPVHDALLELEKSRIIEIFPQRGCRIAMIDYKRIEEARFLRMVIEAAVIEQACKSMTPELIAKLEENLKLQEFYLQNDPARLFELDNAFHKTIYEACDKLQCHYMVSLMGVHFDRVRNLSLNTVKDIKIVEDHKQIFEAIKAGDSGLAKATFAKHMARFEVDWNEITKDYSEYIAE